MARSAIRLGEVRAVGDSVYWAERHPSEGGRTTVLRARPESDPEELVSQPFNVRTRAQEYGGGAWLAMPDGLFFSHFADQRLYILRTGEEARALTAEGPWRFAEACHDARRQRLIAVREDHSGDGEPTNTLVAVDTSSGEVRTLAEGADFYSNPVLSPDGDALAWLEWSHPLMPWDGTKLFVAELDAAGSIGARRHVAGADRVSVFQPQWAPGGELVYVADETGWWNLYSWVDGDERPLAPKTAEFGLPQWVFGQSTYSISPDGKLWCAYGEGGQWKLGLIESIQTPRLQEISTPYTEIDQLGATGSTLYFRAGAPDMPQSIAAFDLAREDFETIRYSAEPDKKLRRYYSIPRAIEFPTTGGETAHGYFYAPRNPDFSAPDGERPPLVVISHGGPTAANSNGFSPAVQFWTTRGYGVVDVNYRGSTGYGRAYRDRLHGNWGVFDIDDCCQAALHLAEMGLADRDRLLIRGGSAGGYTTLGALAFRDVFAAGASYYGVGDLEALAQDTHKFESRYLDGLIGPYPESVELYHERSPIHHVHGFDRPVIVLQGSDDKVVPPNQAESIVKALREKGVLVAYVLFDGEGHGFRRAENIEHALNAELAFYDVAVVQSGLRF